MRLVIDRSKWLRGEADESMLLRPRDGKMCCLGFYALALGFAPDMIKRLASPGDTPEPDRWPAWLLEYIDERGIHRDTDVCDVLIRENDAPTAPEADREARIAAIFDKHGVAVEFI